MAVKIVWDVKQFERVRRASSVDALLRSSAEAIAAGCGEGYEASQVAGKTRSRASVITATAEAMADNAANNTLISNLDRGRV